MKQSVEYCLSLGPWVHILFIPVLTQTPSLCSRPKLQAEERAWQFGPGYGGRQRVFHIYTGMQKYHDASLGVPRQSGAPCRRKWAPVVLHRRPGSEGSQVTPGKLRCQEGAERLHERRDLLGSSPLPEPGTPASGSAALPPRAGSVAASTHDP